MGLMARRIITNGIYLCSKCGEKVSSLEISECPSCKEEFVGNSYTVFEESLFTEDDYWKNKVELENKEYRLKKTRLTIDCCFVAIFTIIALSITIGMLF